MTYIRLTHIRLYHLDLGFPVYDRFQRFTFTPHIVLQYDLSQQTVISGGITRYESIHNIARKIDLRLYHYLSLRHSPHSFTCPYMIKWFSANNTSQSSIYPIQGNPLPPLQDLNLIQAFESLPLYYLRLLLARNLKFIDLERFVTATLQEHNKRLRLLSRGIVRTSLCD